MDEELGYVEVPNLTVYSDDPEPIGELLGPKGEVLRVVYPLRRAMGFSPR